MLCRAMQDGQVTVKSSDKTWSTGGDNGNPFQYSSLEKAMNSMKRQKDMTPEDKPQGQKGDRATGVEQRAIINSSRKNEVAGPKQNNS